MDWEVDESVCTKLTELRDCGFEGRDLVDALLTDDWGAPPTSVQIVGTLSNGTVVDERIVCETRRRRR